MAYCKKCKKVVSTTVQFDRDSMIYLVCKSCEKRITEKEYEDFGKDDYYEAGFMNDFGDSN